jgi:hypothetical protein
VIIPLCRTARPQPRGEPFERRQYQTATCKAYQWCSGPSSSSSTTLRCFTLYPVMLLRHQPPLPPPFHGHDHGQNHQHMQGYTTRHSGPLAICMDVGTTKCCTGIQQRDWLLHKKFERQFPTQGADRQEWQFKLEHQNDQCTEPLAMLGLNIHDRNQYASFIACLSRF